MKCAIYVRTSSKEQFPENQIEPCKAFALSRGYEIQGIYIEKLSGFKDVDRPNYNLVKDKAFKGEIKAVIVWALDRWVRNRETLLEDVTTLRQYGCKLHSVQESWLEAINIDGSLGKTIQEFLLGLVGSLGEMESQRKSERIKIAYDKVKLENRSYKKWGRKNLPDRVIKEVLELHHKGITQRNISKQITYYDKHGNLKNISLGKVNEIIKSDVH